MSRAPSVLATTENHKQTILFPAKKNETGKLFRLVDPYIKRMLDKLYLREISHAEWDSMKEKIQTEQEVIESVITASEQDFEFPYYTKFLLLAAYISSYNPARLDLRYFTKGGEGSKKATKRVGKGADRQRMLEGPRSFPLARMLAIFHNIIEDPIDNTVDIQTQVPLFVCVEDHFFLFLSLIFKNLCNGSCFRVAVAL